MKSQHTPGVWIAEKADDYGDHNIGPFDGLPVGVAVSNLRSKQEVEANAQLFAAAPETAAERDRLKKSNAELLEALERFVKWWDDYIYWSNEWNNVVDEKQFDKEKATLKKAITKAKGTP